MSTDKSMTRTEAATYIAGLSPVEKRQLDAEDPTDRPRVLEHLRRLGLLDSFLAAECGRKT